MPTSVPRPTFGPAGFVAPAESEILAGVIADINSAFGGNVNPALSTPQGQLASSEAAIVGNANNTFVYYTNQTDPAFATGRMQDAIGRFYDLEREPAEPTAVQAICSGLTGVVIPVGALAIAQDGNIYSCTEAGTIPSGGSVTLSFACTVTGPIACPTGTLNAIYKALPGWDSIFNQADGVPGHDVESRTEFETRRQQSVSKNAIGSLPAVLGSVLSVPGVLDAYVTDNVLSTPQVVRGATLPANSLYVAAVGGVAADVARAIWLKKSPGCNTSGNTTVVVEDTNSQYTPPLPTYTINYEIPATLRVCFVVTVSNNPLIPPDALTQIQNALISAFAGGDGGPRARIGSVLYAPRYVPSVAALGPWAQVISLTIGSENAPTSTFTGFISGNILTVTAVLTGAITVGQFMFDAANVILDGSQIVDFGTGHGGIGTYVLGVGPQSVSSRTISGVAATDNFVSVNINQAPVLNADDVAMVLI